MYWECASSVRAEEKDQCDHCKCHCLGAEASERTGKGVPALLASFYLVDLTIPWFPENWAYCYSCAI